jgi:chromosome segregation ATPase
MASAQPPQPQHATRTTTRELPEQLSAVQRNYATVAHLLHERIRQHQGACSQLEAERSLVQELQAQLAAANSTAAVASQQLQQFTQQLGELQQLRAAADTLRAAQQASEQQCASLQEQLVRVQHELFAAATSKQAALQLLQEREQQLTAVSGAASSMKQQLEEHQRCV